MNNNGLSQHFDATFNLTKAASIDLLSKSQIGAGLISALVSAAFIFLKLGRRKLFHPTLTLIYSLFLFGCLSLITLDYPWAEKIAVAGNSNATGCNPEKFSWCYHTKKIPTTWWIVLGGFFLGSSMPLSLISQDTLFSRVIEKSSRSDLHQGMYAAVECLTLTLVPPISGPCYAHFGQHKFYGVIGSIQIVIFIRFCSGMSHYKNLSIDGDEKKATENNANDGSIVPYQSSDGAYTDLK